MIVHEHGLFIRLDCHCQRNLLPFLALSHNHIPLAEMGGVPALFLPSAFFIINDQFIFRQRNGLPRLRRYSGLTAIPGKCFLPQGIDGYQFLHAFLPIKSCQIVFGQRQSLLRNGNIAIPHYLRFLHALHPGYAQQLLIAVRIIAHDA